MNNDKIFYLHNICLVEDESLVSLDYSFIPASFKRRMSKIEKLSLFLAKESSKNLSQNVPSVFVSRFGEWNKTIELMKEFYEDRELSPQGFSTSVHNASAGFFSIIFNNKESYTAIAGGKDSIENGILESYCMNTPNLFVFSEEETPEFYKDVAPRVKTFGFSFFISKKESDFKIVVKNTTNDCREDGDVLTDMFLFLKKEKQKINFNNYFLEKITS